LLASLAAWLAKMRRQLWSAGRVGGSEGGADDGGGAADGTGSHRTDASPGCPCETLARPPSTGTPS